MAATASRVTAFIVLGLLSLYVRPTPLPAREDETWWDLLEEIRYVPAPSPYSFLPPLSEPKLSIPVLPIDPRKDGAISANENFEPAPSPGESEELGAIRKLLDIAEGAKVDYSFLSEVDFYRLKFLTANNTTEHCPPSGKLQATRIQLGEVLRSLHGQIISRFPTKRDEHDMRHLLETAALLLPNSAPVAPQTGMESEMESPPPVLATLGSLEPLRERFEGAFDPDHRLEIIDALHHKYQNSVKRLKESKSKLRECNRVVAGESVVQRKKLNRWLALARHEMRPLKIALSRRSRCGGLPGQVLVVRRPEVILAKIKAIIESHLDRTVSDQELLERVIDHLASIEQELRTMANSFRACVSQAQERYESAPGRKKVLDRPHVQ